MTINVLLFGRLASITENKVISAVIDDGDCSVARLLDIIYSRYPALRHEKFRVVRNHDIADDNDTVSASDEIALLPPVSGGGYSYLTWEPVDTAFLESLSRRQPAGTGSVITFKGVVRNDRFIARTDNEVRIKRVSSIYYSAYESLAEKEINQIVVSAVERFGLNGVIIKHRLGDVKVGETAFFVSVESGHRKEGLSGIDFIIDEVKSRAPIWKLERFEDGSESWKEGQLIEAPSPDRDLKRPDEARRSGHGVPENRCCQEAAEKISHNEGEIEDVTTYEIKQDRDNKAGKGRSRYRRRN
ncbi:MAG TPA: molybdenum cofactor biosynthesis protein MoaE [Thermodesulfobacteriota bacterium]|nr:molybdenum cofactor biosynthesis protein MoaE [Thermodesulfobacteriota bacterium]